MELIKIAKEQQKLRESERKKTKNRREKKTHNISVIILKQKKLIKRQHSALYM